MIVSSGDTLAVLPVAGLGSRLRPLTDVCPKELLPVGRKPAFDWILDELHAAGIEEAVLVTSPSKDTVFRSRYGARSAGIALGYVVQPRMLGLGDALERAAEAAGGRDVLLALGDALIDEPTPGGVTRRVMDAPGRIAIAVQSVPRAMSRRYGIVRPAARAEGPAFAISGIVEKPGPEDAPSDFAVCARYRLPYSIFAALGACPRAEGVELPVTGAIDTLLAGGVDGCAVPLSTDESRHDIGGFDTYFRAFLAFAIDDETHGAALRTTLGDMLE